MKKKGTAGGSHFSDCKLYNFWTVYLDMHPAVLLLVY